MSRGDKWTEHEELRNTFPSLDEAKGGCVISSNNNNILIDDSESHIGVFGNTGYGKSSCVVLPHVITCAYKKEAMLITDPKGEIREITEGLLREIGYKIIILDFRNPSKSPDGINLLQAPYELFKTGDPNLMDIASNDIDELVHNIYPVSSHADPFWPMSASDLAAGLIYSLYDIAEKEERNLASVSRMIQQSEQRKNARVTYINEFAALMANNEIAREHLDGYVSAPSDTRGSIHTTASQGMAVFSRSIGLVQMLSNDTVDVNSLDVKEPIAVFVIVPDDSDTYDQLAGIIVSQLTHHYIRLAHERYQGKLPRRLNVIIEELGSIGRAISSLPSLMVSARSRNVRVMLVLQDRNQLVDVFGESKAATINACIGINYVFSSNNYQALGEWANRCGMKVREVGEQTITEPLITASQLAAMPIGTALIIIRNRYKYIEKLKFYNEIFDIPKTDIENRTGWYSRHKKRDHKIFNMKKYVDDKTKEAADAVMQSNIATMLERNGIMIDKESQALHDPDAIIEAIDKRIEELDKEMEKAASEKKTE